jgi:outer membrane lipoprotein-sorting protein
MKSIRKSILAVIVCLAAFGSASAQTADEIIQKHLAAIGGLDNWKKVTSVKMTGSTNAGGMEIPVIITILRGKGMKAEYTFNGMTGYTIITDKTGWNFSPFAGQTKPEVIPDETIKKAQDGLDIGGPMIDYVAKGNKITYLGKDDVEGTDCYKLKCTYPTGKEETIYIDATNYYHIRSVEKVKANDKETEQNTSYGNFQKLPEGITFPMSMDGGMGSVTFKSIEINKPIDVNFFKPEEPKTNEVKK